MKKKSIKKATILMTQPFPLVKSPIQELVPLLNTEIIKSGWRVEKFYYGRWKNHAVLHEQLINLVSNIIRFIFVLCTRRIRIIQLNSAFDKHGVVRDILFSLVGRLAGKQTLLVFHGSADNLLYRRSCFWHTLASLVFSLAHKVGLLSSQEKKDFYHYFPTHEQKFTIVKNPIAPQYLARETAVTKPDCGSILASLGKRVGTDSGARPKYASTAQLACAPTKSYYILFASRLMLQKGLCDFIQAIRHLALQPLPAGLQIHGLLAGSGPDKNTAQALIKELKLDNHLTYLGFVPPETLQAIFAAVDVFVFPSHFPEGMPMALTHAMASGVPVITTRVRFARSYLKEPDNCLFIDTGRPAELAEKIRYLMENPGLRETMVANNYQFLKAYATPIVGREYLAIYENLLNQA